MKKLLKKIGQLQYEISCLDLDEETLTGVTIRTDELKELIKKWQTLPIDSVVVSSSNICTDTNEECKHNCSGLCKERC